MTPTSFFNFTVNFNSPSESKRVFNTEHIRVLTENKCMLCMSCHILSYVISSDGKAFSAMEVFVSTEVIQIYQADQTK